MVFTHDSILIMGHQIFSLRNVGFRKATWIRHASISTGKSVLFLLIRLCKFRLAFVLLRPARAILRKRSSLPPQKRWPDRGSIYHIQMDLDQLDNKKWGQGAFLSNSANHSSYFGSSLCRFCLGLWKSMGDSKSDMKTWIILNPQILKMHRCYSRKVITKQLIGELRLCIRCIGFSVGIQTFFSVTWVQEHQLFNGRVNHIE